MYLIVFASVIIAMIGIYTQVLGVQTARIWSHQNAVAGAMLIWNGAAVSMAASIIKTNPSSYASYSATGCSLTAYAPPGFATCPSPLFGLNGWQIDGSGTVTTASGSPNLNLIYNTHTNRNECVHLPSTCSSIGGNGCNVCNPPYYYDVVDFQFYSVLYKDPTTNHNFVVTFVPVTSNATPPYLTLARGNKINLTAADLMQQLRHAGKPNYVFGNINTTAQLVVHGSTYTLPPGFLSFPGAVATISSPEGF